jgi:hypothetical protein
LTTITLTIGLLAAPLFAAPMSKDDREHLLVHFEMTTQMRVPLDKNEGGVNGIVVLGSAETPLFAREVEDQDSGNLTLNHSPVEDRSTNHRFGLNIDHDSSMRTSPLYGMRERPINPAV